MNLFFLLLALFGATESQRKLTYDENQEIQRLCGRKPYPRNEFLDQRVVDDNEYSRKSIYNGFAISGIDSPWSVYLKFAESRCTGTLISSRHILTATHCLQLNASSTISILDPSRRSCEYDDMIYKPRSDKFLFYSSNLQLLSSDVARIALLSMCLYDDVEYDDLAILELREDIQFSNYVQPICVPRNMDLEEMNSWMQVTGFGYDSKTIGEKGKFQPLLRHAWMAVSEFHDDRRSFKVQNTVQEVGMREGDSGGPAFIENTEKRNYVIGIASATLVDNSAWYSSVGRHNTDICRHTGVC